MSHEVQLVVQAPSISSTEGILHDVAQLLGASVANDEDGSRNVHRDGLLVYVVEPDEEDSRTIRQLFGLNNTLTLILTDLSQGDNDMMTRVQRNIIRLTLMLAHTDGSHGVLAEDLNPYDLVLEFHDGEVTLNQDWEGWKTWPEVLDVVPAPQRMESFRKRAR